MKSPSLRTRLSIWAAAVFGLIISIFGAGVSIHLYHEVLSTLRTRLRSEASAFFTTYQEHSSDLKWSDVSQIQTDFRMTPMFHPFEVFDRKGNSLYRSLGLGGMSLEQLPLEPGFYRHIFAEKKYEVGIFHRDGLTLKIVGDMEGVDDVGINLIFSCLLAGPIMLLVGSFGSWWLLRRAFMPVDQIVAAAEKITAQKLHERLPVPGSQDEISRLTIVLNNMIDRLEVSFNQANRFTADASHELRTPLTIIRNELELQVRGHQGQPATQKVLVGLLEQTTRLNSITEKLLMLSRADAGQLPLRFKTFNLSEMIQNLVEDAEVLGTDMEISIEAHVSADIWIDGDRELLHQLLLNLIDNAVKYNQLGGTIWVDLQNRETTVEIHVSNTGSGIPQTESNRIFDRFYRGAQTRGMIAGQGLGLSLCREIALAHRGEIQLKGGSGRTEFILTLPKVKAIKPTSQVLLTSG